VIRLLLVGCFVAWSGNSMGAGQQGEIDRREVVVVGSDLEIEDPAKLVVELFGRNRELTSEVARLNEEIEHLQRQLAEVRAKLDLQKDGTAGAAWVAEKPDAGLAYDDITRLRVLEVNREMKVVVISGGLRAGMKVGMTFSVLREDEVLGLVRIIDVREHIAGGLIEQVEKGRFPQVGDRLVLIRIQDG